MPEPELPQEIKDAYQAIDRGAHWVCLCKVCRQGWKLPKDYKIGAALFLLNHAAGHKKATPSGTAR